MVFAERDRVNTEGVGELRLLDDVAENLCGVGEAAVGLLRDIAEGVESEDELFGGHLRRCVRAERCACWV